MSPSREVLRELARPRSAADRLRARMTTAATAGIGAAVLMAASVAGIPDDTSLQSYQPQAAQAGLAPYLAQSGLRPGATLGALMLVLPFAALAVQAMRVGSLSLRREAGLLALAGAAPADLRRLRVVRTRAAFARGGLWSAPAYVVAWLLLGVALPAGWRLLPAPQWWLPAAWLVVLGLLTAIGVVVGRRAPRAAAGEDGDAAEPSVIVRPNAAPGRAPSAWWAWTTGAAAAALFTTWLRSGRATAWTIAGLGAAIGLLAVCTAVLLARRAVRGRSRARGVRGLRRTRGGDAAVAVLSSAQRRANPVAAGTVGAVLFVCGLASGVLAVLVLAYAGLDGVSAGGLGFYAIGVGVPAAAACVGVVVALLALALDLTDHLMAARRSVAATAALGPEPRRLVAVQVRALTDTAVPAVVAGSLVSGIVYAGMFIVTEPGRWWLVLAAPLTAAVVAGLAVAGACRLVAALLARRVEAAAALEHLRTP